MRTESKFIVRVLLTVLVVFVLSVGLVAFDEPPRGGGGIEYPPSCSPYLACATPAPKVCAPEFRVVCDSDK